MNTLDLNQGTLALSVEILPDVVLSPNVYLGVEFTGVVKMVDENGSVLAEHHFDREMVRPSQPSYHQYHLLVNAVTHLISDAFYLHLKSLKKSKAILEKRNTRIVCFPERVIAKK